MVVAHLVERLLLIPEIRSSNPDNGNILSTNWTLEKTKIEKKRPGLAHLKNNILSLLMTLKHYSPLWVDYSFMNGHCFLISSRLLLLFRKTFTFPFGFQGLRSRFSKIQAFADPINQPERRTNFCHCFFIEERIFGSYPWFYSNFSPNMAWLELYSRFMELQ